MALLARPEGLSPEQMDELDSVFKAPGLVATLISVFCAFGGWYVAARCSVGSD